MRDILCFLLFTLWIGNASSQVIAVKIIPKRTDTAINTFTNTGYEHYIYLDKTVKKRNELLVFLPGTNGKGAGAKSFNEFAASLGYHVINLIYPNDFTLSRYQRNLDISNYEKGREEIITGKDLSKEISVDKANSIENRLNKVLLRLVKLYPKQGWGQYLNSSNEMIWSRIALAGQSQGGGHAAFIAKNHAVARVIMFASPKDYSVRFAQPASWIAKESRTPVNKQYSFVHRLDDRNACTYEEQQQIWKNYGLYKYGNEVNVDSIMPPYKNTHLLTSSKPQKSPHSSVINDITYESAWRYMLTNEN